MPAGNNRGATTNNETSNLAMVAQSFSWEDQMQVLNLIGHEAANLPQISENSKVEKAEEEMMELQFTFMVSTTSTTKEVSATPCS